MEISGIVLAMANCILQSYASYRIDIVIKVKIPGSNNGSIIQGNYSPKFLEIINVYSN